MVAPDLPSPLRTWYESQNYILNPFFKDGEIEPRDSPLRFI